MNDDLLKRATQALRHETEAANLRSGLTRARVLESASKRYANARRFWPRLFVAIASVFVVGTALARVSEEWPALREVARSLPLFVDKKPPPAKHKPRAPVRKAPPVVAPAQPQPTTIDSKLSVPTADTTATVAPTNREASPLVPPQATPAQVVRGHA